MVIVRFFSCLSTNQCHYRVRGAIDQMEWLGAAAITCLLLLAVDSPEYEKMNNKRRRRRRRNHIHMIDSQTALRNRSISIQFISSHLISISSSSNNNNQQDRQTCTNICFLQITVKVTFRLLFRMAIGYSAAAGLNTNSFSSVTGNPIDYRRIVDRELLVMPNAYNCSYYVITSRILIARGIQSPSIE